MNWIEIKIFTTGEAHDAISDMLTVLGASGVAIVDPDEIKLQVEALTSVDYIDSSLVESYGEDVIVKAYFPDSRSETTLVNSVKEGISKISKYLNTGKGTVEVTFVCDEDWANNWKKYYKPFEITDNIVIKPTWEDYIAKNDEVVIQMDPGMAFGTGTHETTKMCAELLQKHMKAGYIVADIGCGTGILSIIAAKCGAIHVSAVDNDEVAVKIANSNAQLNNVSKLVDVRNGTIEDIPHKQYDVIVANIVADVIIGFIHFIPTYLKDDGAFIASGIIGKRQQEVIYGCERVGLKCSEVLNNGEWVAMSFKCQGSL